MFYTNACCLTNKITELKQLILENKYDIMCVSETHFTDELSCGEYEIPGFSCYRADRDFKLDRTTSNKMVSDCGGSAIYVNQSIEKSFCLRWTIEHYSKAQSEYTDMLERAKLFLFCVHFSVGKQKSTDGIPIVDSCFPNYIRHPKASCLSMGLLQFAIQKSLQCFIVSPVSVPSSCVC